MNNMHGSVRRLLGAFACILALGTQATTAFAGPNDAKVAAPGGRAELDAKAAGGKVKVIVNLNIRRPFRPAGYLPGDQAQDQRSAIGEAQSQLMRELAGLQVSDVRHFTETPQMAMSVSSVELDRLLNSPVVESVVEDQVKMLHLDVSVPLIGAAIMKTQGLNGAGAVVAILDTGVQKDHPFLTGAVVSEACYSTTFDGSAIKPPGTPYVAQSLCPAGAASSTATNSALPYATGVCLAGQCDHGTHVAGIVAGRANAGVIPGGGVASGASLIAVQVFSKVTSTGYCGSATPCALAFDSDIISGLQRVLALRNTYNIASVNLSLGGGKWTSYCDSDINANSAKPTIDSLRSFNIATVVASGNSNYTDGISSPACISSAVSVGATTKLDAVATTYSNSANFLSMLAPGSSINSSIPFTSYGIKSGTSMATPHVAGAWALLRQARPTASVNDVYNALVNTGVPILDPRNGITKPRIQVNLAAASLPFAPGLAKIGVFREGYWYLDANGNRAWDNVVDDKMIWFGQAGDLPIVGDWNGDGRAKIGVFRDGYWYLDYNGNGVWDPGIDKFYWFGQAGDTPVVGDWNHDGKAKIGVFRDGQWYLDYNGNGSWDGFATDRFYWFGMAGDKPIIGDWSGNGISKIGIFRNGLWCLDYNGNGLWDGAPTDTVYWYGMSGDSPVAGDWSGNGISKIGVFRNGWWYLDYDGTGAWNGTIADQAFWYGMTGDKPLAGKTWN